MNKGTEDLQKNEKIDTFTTKRCSCRLYLYWLFTKICFFRFNRSGSTGKIDGSVVPHIHVVCDLWNLHLIKLHTWAKCAYIHMVSSSLIKTYSVNFYFLDYTHFHISA